MEVEADVKYTIHLGDFSDGNFNNFDVERDHYYKYTVTVNGVDEIIAEVETNRENQPGAEGVVFRKGSRVSIYIAKLPSERLARCTIPKRELMMQI